MSAMKRQAPIAGNNQGGNNQGYGYGYGYNGPYDSGNDVNWWWTPTGMAVRYALVALFFGSILIFFVGGYIHAQRRMRKGLPLLRYHRWMAKRQNYYPPQPRYGYPQDPQRQSYGMDAYPQPPPAYNNAEAPPPVYQPPPGATKVMADQGFGQTNRAGEGSGGAGVPAPAPTQQ